MKKLYKLIFIAVLVLSFSNTLNAENQPHFIDFTKVLNESKAGKGAQDFLKNKFKKESVKFSKLEQSIRKEEQDVINKKKLVTNDEYLKLVKALRDKVGKLQKDKQDSIKNVAKLRQTAKTDLLKILNPIIKKYMEDNKIRLVLDKKSILLGDQNLEITSQIIEILNKKVTSLNLK
jgi:outer membrane protein